jgi:hypothetical protein
VPGPNHDSVLEMPGLTARERTRLSGILARLASPFEGERAAAALLASVFIEKHGLQWSAVTGLLEVRVDRATQPAARKVYPVVAAQVAVTGKVERRGSGVRSWRGYDRRRHMAAGASVNISL